MRPLCLSLLLVLSACPKPADPDKTVPSVPSSVSAQVSGGQIQVSWTNTASDATVVVIGRAIVPTTASTPAQTELHIIGSVMPDATGFVDPDVEPGRIYVYGVAARNEAGRSDFALQTGTISLMPMAGPCAAVQITATDSDGDGLDDADETAGWQVTIDEDGQGTMSMRQGRSSPYDPDTDRDGLCDDDERQLKLDPRQADSDGDGLSDFDEVNRWGSSPTNVDSDQDAQGNSAFYDGSELLAFGTSPTLADSDGDGRSDFDEVNQNGTNPLAAELPQPKLEIVSDIDLDVHVTTSMGVTTMNAASQSFARSTNNTLSKTASTSNTTSTESSVEISAEATVGIPGSASATVTGTYSTKEGYVQETSSSVSSQSQQSSEQTFDTLTTDLLQNDKTVNGGHIAVDFEIQNVGTRSFQLSQVVVTALRRSRTDPKTFTSIATLAFPSTADNLVLSEGQKAGPIRAQADIAGNVALDLLSNPGAIYFRTANFNLVDRTGAAFQFSIGETTSSRTAQLTLDFGGYRPLERHRIATNVERTSDGKAAGVRLGDALDRILGLAPGVGYQVTQRTGTGKRVVSRVREVATTPQADGGVDRFWVVLAGENPDTNLQTVATRLLSSTADIDDVVLMPRDSITLAFVADHDRDGLLDREELSFGTFDGAPDTDSDGLTDFEEVRTGWTVPVALPYYQQNPKVFSSPTVADLDGDGWTDPVEKQNGTDPNRRDTDADGIADPLDRDPTSPATGTFVRLLGTAMDDSAQQVFAGPDQVWLYGTSAGDIDGDGMAGGPYVMAVDPSNGTTRWTVQLEGVLQTSRKITVEADGTTHWVTDVRPGNISGFAGGDLSAVRITKAGVVSANLITTVSNFANAFTLLGSSEPGIDGGVTHVGTWLFSPTDSASRAVALTSSGTRIFDTNTGSDMGGQRHAIVSSASVGHLIVTSETASASACRVSFYRDWAPQGRVTFCSGAHPGKAGPIGVDSASAAYVASIEAQRNRLERISSIGQTLWARTFLGDFTNPRVTAVDVDAVNNIFVGLWDENTGARAGIELLRSDQSRFAIYRLGNGTTRVTSSRRDPVGNLFTTGTTTGGFLPTPLGGTDIVLIRNPQLTFGSTP